MERSTAKAIAAGTLMSLVLLGGVVGAAVVGFLIVGNALDLWPDQIDAAPLNEVVGDLEVLKSPTNHCPESADQCWASVVVSSGQNRGSTAAIVAENADRAGFKEVEGFTGRWTAKRGGWCLSTYEPSELRVYDAGQFPTDALYVGLNSC